MTRADFVIISEARTGSNLLMYAVADHPEVVCYGECFSEHSNEHYRTKIDTSPRAWHLVRGGIHHELLPEFDIDTPPLTVLNEFIYRDDYPESVRAVGFKYHWFQGRPASPWSATRGLLRDRANLRVIHLYRENLLEQLASTKLAQATKRWVVWNENELDHSEPQIHLPLQYVRGFFADQTKNIEMISQNFRSHRYLKLSYEQLVADFPQQYDRVQECLGLTLRPAPRPRTRKQSRRPMRDMIVNYDELRDAFANTQWACFFTEERSDAALEVPISSQC